MPEQSFSIFISYSRVDSAFVNRLEADLHSNHFRTWVDRSQLEGGQIWMDVLQQAIDHCDVMLVVLSPDSVVSKYVRIEYGYAYEEKKVIIPLEYRPCKLPIDLRQIQSVNFKNEYDRGLLDTIKALKYAQKSLEQAKIVADTGSLISENISFPSQSPIRLDEKKETLFVLPSPHISRRVAIGAGIGGLASIGAFFASFHIFSSSPTTQNLGPRKPIFLYQNHSSAVFAVTWSPDNRTIASAGRDETLQVWQAANGNLLWMFENFSAPVNALAWSHDGNYLASASDDQMVRIWHAMKGSLLSTYHGHSSAVHGVAWSPDSTHIASSSSDGTVQVWQALTTRHLWTGGDSAQRQLGSFWGVDWSRDGAHIAVASSNGRIYIWDADGNRVHSYTGHSSGARYVVWSPDKKRIAAGSLDKTVRVWESLSNNNPKIFSKHSGQVYGVTWSPDSNDIASGDTNGAILAWSATDEQVKFTASNSPSGGIFAVVWSPNGKYIAAGTSDSKVVIWATS